MATLSEQTSRRVFVGLVIVSLVGVALVARPLATALFVAAIAAGMLAPVHRRFAKRLGNRPKLSASILVFSLFVLVLAPIAGLAAFAVKEAGQGYKFVTETVRSEGMVGLVKKLPAPAEKPAMKMLERIQGKEPNKGEPGIEEQAAQQGVTAAKAMGGIVSATGTILFQTAMMLIALFFLLLEGGWLVAWLERISPLKPGQTYELLSEFKKVSSAVITSSGLTAGVQAAVATVGYFIARVPHPLFFGGITFFIALIPAVGAASVCLAASLLLLATGHPMAALFLAIWGVVVVGLVDNVVKPLLAKRGMNMHGGVVFFALLGGIAAFGMVGLLVGPLAVSFFLALIRIHERDYATRLPPVRPDEVVNVDEEDLHRQEEAYLEAAKDPH